MWWSVITGIALLAIIVGSALSVRSLIRKWKANPSKWIDLLIGVLIFGAAIVFIGIEFFKHIGIII